MPAVHVAQGLEGAVGLKALAISFNELTSVEGLTSLTRLTCLDLSFNAIQRIQGLKVSLAPLPALHSSYCSASHMSCVAVHTQSSLLLHLSVCQVSTARNVMGKADICEAAECTPDCTPEVGPRP